MMAFKYAEILAVMAERAKVSDTPWDVVQMKNIEGMWVNMWNMPSFHDSHEYRIKPRVIKIGNREVSEPLQIENVFIQSRYWFPALSNTGLISSALFTDRAADHHIFKIGLARRTEAEALELAEAVLEVLNGN